MRHSDQPFSLSVNIAMTETDVWFGMFKLLFQLSTNSRQNLMNASVRGV